MFCHGREAKYNSIPGLSRIYKFLVEVNQKKRRIGEETISGVLYS
ncbi:hypothetical protein LMG33818_001684 [Halomonadaceae bacterium LMG 33818]